MLRFPLLFLPGNAHSRTLFISIALHLTDQPGWSKIFVDEAHRFTFFRFYFDLVADGTIRRAGRLRL
jgi:hypothetical protein